ncbi:HalOD1 output domain-containing protein [Halegenticoccus tardaugens]|uniref:HalOD1 output domain-containing protein n=1 Tax=Halegenticoccus tardaugens TaxID=2071624 RepID=UPI00100B0F19|nr:HalOD1 output domain-containing protein [Halegenticoccus tardaugens]
MVSEQSNVLRRLRRGTGNCLLRYALEEDEELSTAVVDAVNAVRRSRTTSDEPLNDAIDPDALDGLFRAQYDGTPRTDGIVIFEHWGFLIVVETAGAVFVYDRPDGGRAAE